ncbi:MAG: neutral/alkaline non-lysosomal ceramidase N-terminal domain-containing protein, partial [Acidobacteriota bacterium]
MALTSAVLTARSLTLAALCLCAIFSLQPVEAASRWKAGVASIDITPVAPVWMAGYAARTRPSEGTLAPLRAKALALKYGQDKPAVLVAADLLGFPADVSRRVAVRLQESLGLQRDRIIFSASHTHGGPVVRHSLAVAYDLDAAAQAAVEAYTIELEDKIVAVVGSALRGLQPARLGFGQTRATFAANRRQLRDGQSVGRVQRPAPVDHDVQ